jgi:hypothetical protein
MTLLFRVLGALGMKFNPLDKAENVKFEGGMNKKYLVLSRAKYV